jgi:hypothetical protein
MSRFQREEFKWPEVSVKCQDFSAKVSKMEIHFGVKWFKKEQILGWWVHECEGTRLPRNTVATRYKYLHVSGSNTLRTMYCTVCCNTGY